MKVYAIGDLHLPGNGVKPMDVFGAHWENHFAKIAEDWRARVQSEDVVLIPGDISWAMYLQDAAADLAAIGRLPGQKILLRGNHDYWWSAIGKVRAVLPKGMHALQNDAMVLGGHLFCGTRGWTIPGADYALSEEDDRIYRREVLRLEMSLRTARRLAPDLPMTVMMHYPPVNDRSETSEFLSLIQSFDARRLVYGHLHGAGLRNAPVGVWGNVAVHQVSCDGLGFRLLCVEEVERAWQGEYSTKL